MRSYALIKAGAHKGRMDRIALRIGIVFQYSIRRFQRCIELAAPDNLQVVSGNR